MDDFFGFVSFLWHGSNYRGKVTTGNLGILALEGAIDAGRDRHDLDGYAVVAARDKVNVD